MTTKTSRWANVADRNYGDEPSDSSMVADALAAADSGQTSDPALLAALDTLERLLTAGGDVTDELITAEVAVVDAWLSRELGIEGPDA